MARDQLRNPFMSIESVRAFFAEKAPDIIVIESSLSSATVTLAFQVLFGVLGRTMQRLAQ